MNKEITQQETQWCDKCDCMIDGCKCKEIEEYDKSLKSQRIKYPTSFHQKTRNRKIKNEVQSKLKEYKRTLKCDLCHEDHIACIDLHHKEERLPGHKDIAMLVRNGHSWDFILNEIVTKCQPLCSNCHRKTHWCVKCDCVSRNCKCKN